MKPEPSAMKTCPSLGLMSMPAGTPPMVVEPAVAGVGMAVGVGIAVGSGATYATAGAAAGADWLGRVVCAAGTGGGGASSAVCTVTRVAVGSSVGASVGSGGAIGTVPTL